MAVAAWCDRAAAAGELGEVGLEVGDGAAQGCGVDGGDAGVEVVLVVGVEQVGPALLEALVGSQCGVVGLGDLGAIAGLGGELLLGQEQVDQFGLGGPDLVEQGEFSGGVVAVVALSLIHI